ncbi:MAG: ral secretion pathway protein, partial [Pseudomonadota bacterium]
MTPRRPPFAPRQCQRGAALLLAMILVTLVTTLAAGMVWQQWRAVQVEAAERARSQSAWILSGALDWARLILREDARSGGADDLTEPWATALAEIRLSTFLAADKNNNADDSGPDAFLSGSITDAQARYNLRNLIVVDKLAPAELLVLERLLDGAGLPRKWALQIGQGLLDATLANTNGQATTDDSNPPLLPQSVAQLAWFGLDAEGLQRLAPLVVLLPQRTPINLNTASREVLAAVINTDLSSAERLVQVRQRSPYKDLPGAAAQLPATAVLDPDHVDVKSSFFEVRGRLRLG